MLTHAFNVNFILQVSNLKKSTGIYRLCTLNDSNTSTLHIYEWECHSFHQTLKNYRIVMIVPFWLAYILARQGFHKFRPTFANFLYNTKERRGNMGTCLCRDKSQGGADYDSRNTPGSPSSVSGEPPPRGSARDTVFTQGGRQWRLGIADSRGSHSHNGRSSSGSSSHKKHGSMASRSIDSLVLETLALIRTLVDK